MLNSDTNNILSAPEVHIYEQSNLILTE